MATVHLKVSYPPYTRGSDSIEKIMYSVALALLPATIASVYFFGWRALWVNVVAIASCVGFEWVINKMRKREHLTCFDGSAVVTGLLLALNVPSNLPYWMLILGSFVAIVVTKEIFGGLGFNTFNPALVARVFLLISFPVAMTSWPMPSTVDMATGASPLGLLKTEGVGAIADITLWQAAMGQIRGSMGETSAILLLLGGTFLWIRKYITCMIPMSFMITTFLFTGIFYLIDPAQYADPLFHLFTGGLILGAVFMATDMVTSPLSKKGQLIFGVGCGLLTGVIRLWGGYPEGVSFAILIMNSVVPLIDRWDLASRTRRLEVKP
jgi:electron transport complex protein RnfD